MDLGIGKKERRRKDREEKQMIRCLCAVLYLFIVLNFLGVSLDFGTEEKMHYHDVGMVREAMSERVSDKDAGKVMPDIPDKGSDDVSGKESDDVPDEKPDDVPGKESDEETGETAEYADGPKRIALTFDDGPNVACTGRLLDGLKKRNVRATFFVIGKNVRANPKLTKRIYEEGHMIGNHTYSHIDMSKVSEGKAEKELKKTSRTVHAITGEYPQYMRPPYGVCSKKLEDSLDMLLVRWTIDPLDWKSENTDDIVKKVVTKAEENDIILLHDCYNTSVDAAFKIIDILQKKGFAFVTVDELFLD